MSEALTPATYINVAYRIAMAETVRTVLEVGRCAPGDRVINYCAGAGDANLAIAERIAPGGLLYSVDADPEKVAELALLARDRDLTDAVRPQRQDAMTAAEVAHVPTHVTCLFGLHQLADPVLATRRWAVASSPATKMLTADWAAVWDPTSPCRPAELLPTVSTEWALLTSVTLEFQLPPTVPAARRALGGRSQTAMGSVTVREWTRSCE